MGEFLIKLIVCFVAGAGAGIGTGFAGMSAAVVISPMLITFLGLEAYEAVAIALASDVLASAASALIYKKNNNIDIKHGLVMMITILCFTLVGSFISSFVPSTTMSWFSLGMTVFLGLRFLIFPVMTTREHMEKFPPKLRFVGSILAGIWIGLVCGFIGAGGGLMILFVLTFLLGYDLKCAVGTSVFIMSFTAFTGSVSHFAIGGLSDPVSLVLCIIFTLLWAQLAARYANNADPKLLNRVTGIVLVVLAVVMIVVNYVL